jgi:hypothetical protein
MAKKTYLFQSNSKLSNGLIAYLETTLHCNVKELGQTKQKDKWYYQLSGIEKLSINHVLVFNQRGLTLLLHEDQKEKIQLLKDYSSAVKDVKYLPLSKEMREKLNLLTKPT